ncbi:RWD domain-containing protein 4 [Episyrphus balteatus]|uniref:RWD domain-containing protein 4 n=1 Tax=Episyrphus balteatus TaxID=286459 RepID=UPI0024867861|nr:RWD domain-containing protein 4 [Episyrphus balteatus]
MSEQQELQLEEREALQSIYEGDDAFKEVNPTTFQYKYGKDDDIKSFLVEIQWVSNYPNEVPVINMDAFYNRNLIPPVKQKIASLLLEEAEQWVGCGMTYTLFECLKDKVDEIVAEQPDTPIVQSVDLDNGVAAIKISDSGDSKKVPATKKEQLTKAQKRRQWERTDHKGDRPRGYDWVDIVKHLSQTGYKEEQALQREQMMSEPVLHPLNI